jgi:hypothetical protein
MFPRLRKPVRAIVLALLVLPVLVLSACGSGDTRVTTGTYAGESGKNAPYLNVGPLIYEVQLSRELNPANIEDAAYLQGLTPKERTLKPGQEWFAVFIQVYNHHSVAHPAATDFTITDTQENSYSPIVPNETNLFAYRGGLVPAEGQIPEVGSVAWTGNTQGALLLYKILVLSLDNRPLILHIVDPTDSAQTASAELDV